MTKRAKFEYSPSIIENRLKIRRLIKKREGRLKMQLKDKQRL